MIHEKGLDIARAIESQNYKNDGGIISCGHDFWDVYEKAEFGDLLYCGRCHQYFAKIKHLPWLCESKNLLHTNHLTDAFYTPVEVRVTD